MCQDDTIVPTKNLLLVLTLALAATATAHAAVATFDDLPEGGFTTLLNNGGITFSNLDGGFPDFDSFAIDNVSGAYAGAAGYSAPNVLTFNAYDVGSQASFGRMKSFDFTTGALASSASFTVLSIFNDPGNTLILQGLLNGAVVGSTTLALTTEIRGVQSLALGEGLYDSFRVDSVSAEGAVFVGLDNVTINAVPEPATFALLGFGALGLLCRGKRRS